MERWRTHKTFVEPDESEESSSDREGLKKSRSDNELSPELSTPPSTPQSNAEDKRVELSDLRQWHQTWISSDSSTSSKAEMLKSPCKPRDGQLDDDEAPSGEPAHWQPHMSKGSALHDQGECTPCTYMYSSLGCRNGEDCKYCHLEHDKQKRLRKRQRPNKCKREQYLQEIDRAEKTFAEDPETGAIALKALADRNSFFKNKMQDKFAILNSDNQKQETATSSQSQSQPDSLGLQGTRLSL